MAKTPGRDWKARLAAFLRRVLEWGDTRIAPGLRSVLGLLLMVGGVFGFLPVLGFWMLPAGAVLIALDVPPWRRWLYRRLSD